MVKYEKLKIGIIIGAILIISSVIGAIIGLNRSSSVDAKTIQIAAEQAVADAKIASDLKKISDKNNADVKALADTKIKIAEILARQKITQAEILVEEKKTLDAKAAIDAAVKANEIIYTDYNNSKYAFSLKYPNFLINKSSVDELTLGEKSGYIFSSPDNFVTLKVEGWNNTTNDTLQTFSSHFKEEENISIPQGDIFLKKSGDNWLEESYTIRGDIVFQYVIVGPGSINAIKFEYPIAQKEKFLPVVQKLFDSFKTPGIGIQH